MHSAARKLRTLGNLGLMLLVAAACNDTSSFNAIVPTPPPPVGHANVYAWDGVDSRMLMMMSPQPGQDGDPIAWTLNGSKWIRSLGPPATNLIPVLLAYDSIRNRVVLVGTSALVPQTWEWDGHTWNSVVTAHSLPESLNPPLAAFSPELRAVVAFRSGFTPQHTYLYDGTDWRDLVTANAPLSFQRIEYDPIRHRTVAFSEPDYHTWLFDGDNWTALSLPPATTPDYGFASGRQTPASALDEHTGKWVIFGGFDGSKSYDDTWVGDGGSWTKVSPQTSPSARAEAVMAWDPTAGHLVMFGGDTMGSGLLGDTWTWDGASWSRLG